MGRQQIVSFTWTCDLCGNEIPESDAEGASHKISWEAADYLVDLCATHQAQLTETLEQLKTFVDAGQRSPTGRGQRRSNTAGAAVAGASRRRGAGNDGARSAGRSSRSDLGAIRSWARDNGHQVSERGRIAGSVMSAYDDANRSDDPGAPPTPRKRGSRKAAAAS